MDRTISVSTPPGKWRSLTLIALAELLAMTLWFSASAVVPQLSTEWRLTGGEQAWLTMSVQIGFVIGALAGAVFNIADRVPLRLLFALGALFGAAVNALIAVGQPGVGTVIGLRLMTGVALAGVYHPGMKLAATWSKGDRGLAIGVLVGALTLGSAVPHLLNALPALGGVGGMPPWRTIMWTASALAAIAAILAGVCVRPGPFLGTGAPFNWRFAGRALGDRPTRLANFGYLGHMWELYAMWTWVPICLIASYERVGWEVAGARWAGFGVLASGGLGCVLAGAFADRLGRTTITIASLAVSGACCIVAGFFFEQPGVLTAIAIVWGFAVVADSAQFSAGVSELADQRYVGTALTLQTSMGFIPTLVTIRIIPLFLEALGWRQVPMRDYKLPIPSLVGASARFPKYKVPNDRVITLAEMNNNCIKMFTGGKSLDLNSQDSIALAMYITSLSNGENVEVGQSQ